MPIASPNDVGMSIIEALGLDGKVVRSIVIDIRANELPTVKIESYVTDGTNLIGTVSTEKLKLAFKDKVLQPTEPLTSVNMLA